MRLCIAFVLLIAGVTAAGADPRRDEEARAAYKVGAAAYEAGNYQVAYDKFRESFQLSHEPALLYNISSALQGLQRPHDAAEALRSFLRVQPNDPERPKIELRIATLEEEQRMIDLDRHKARPETAPATPAETAPPATVPPPAVTVNAAALVATPPPRRDHKRAALIAGCVAGGVVLVAGAIVLGVLLGDNNKTEPYLMSSLGAHPGTR
jgi:tetratricopeptide (TPR) repeat protein